MCSASQRKNLQRPYQPSSNKPSVKCIGPNCHLEKRIGKGGVHDVLCGGGECIFHPKEKGGNLQHSTRGSKQSKGFHGVEFGRDYSDVKLKFKHSSSSGSSIGGLIDTVNHVIDMKVRSIYFLQSTESRNLSTTIH